MIKKIVKYLIVNFCPKIIFLWLVFNIKNYKKKKGQINVLVFSQERWEEDLKIIGSFNDVNLIFLPSRKVEITVKHTIWHSKNMTKSKKSKIG